ncbi:hypothetical protein ACJX0J_033043, partial [Zea mays]
MIDGENRGIWNTFQMSTTHILFAKFLFTPHRQGKEIKQRIIMNITLVGASALHPSRENKPWGLDACYCIAQQGNWISHTFLSAHMVGHYI